MKKFIKKTIAGLIAGVMAVSSMPFTALAEQTVNDFTVKEATAFGSFESDSDFNDEAHYKQIYKNVLYSPSKMAACYTSGPVSAEGKDKVYLTSKVYYGNTVLLYSGATTPAMGIGFAVVGYSKPWNYRYNNVRAYRCNLSGDTQGITLRDSKWHGYDGRMNYTYTMFGQGETIGTISDSECVQGEKGYYGNVLQYTGGDFTADYKTINLGFEYVVGTNEGSHQTHQTGTIDSASIYVLNYKKLVDKVNNVKKDLSALNTSIYEESSLNNYYTAINNMFAFDPTSYDYSSNQEETVKTVAEDMKSLMTAVDTAKNQLKVKYTFVKADGTSSVVNAVDEAEALANKPTNTASTQKTYAGENQHKWTEYTWPEKATNYTFTEQAIEKTEACNVVNGQCTDCGNVTLDTSAYDAALAEAEAKALNPDNRYTADSINALKAVIDSVKIDRENVKNQTQLNALVTRLQEANNSLVQAKFNVVFVTVGLDSTTENEKFNKYIEYGETCNADAGANVKKWVVTTDNGNTSTVIDNFDQKASFVITKDAKIYAYLSGEDSSTTSSKVTFLGRHNQVVAIRYVAEGMTLDTKTVDAPSIPFYKFENWDVASVKGDGNEYTVKATYTCNQASSDFCTVHFDKWSKAYAYDSYVYLPNTVAGTKYALYSDEQCTKLLTVLDGVDFYAPKASDIYVKAYDAEAEASIAVTGSFAEKDVEKGKKYANFNCKFYLPADANAIEWGVEVLSPDGTRTAKVKAEKLSERNEYTVRFGTSSSSVPSITGRAYLVYVQQNGVKTTIYSPEFVTVNLNA